MKTSSLLVVCGFVLCSTLLMRAGTGGAQTRGVERPRGCRVEPRGPHDCGGEPCDDVVRGSRAFFDRQPDGLSDERTCVRRLPHADGQLPALASRRRSTVSTAPAGGGGGIPRTPTIRCSGRSTRTTSGPTATAPADFSNLRQNGLDPDHVPAAAQHQARSIRRPMQPSAETEVDVWSSVPTVNDVAITGRGRRNHVAAGAERSAVATSWTARFATLQEQANAALATHAQDAVAQRRSGCSTTCRRSSGCSSRTNGSVRCRTPCAEGDADACDPDRQAHARSNDRERRSSSARAASVTAGPGQSTPQATPNDPPAPVIRYHNDLHVNARVPLIRAGKITRSRLARHSWHEMSRTYEIALSIRRRQPRPESRPGRELQDPPDVSPIPAGRW